MLLDTLTSLNQAWEYAIQNFDGRLNPDLICKVVAMIDSTSNAIRSGFGKEVARSEYRNDSVRILDRDAVLPVRPEKIVYQVNELCDLLDTGMHPVEKAALSHFHLVRIHPFEDGNGRTARLVQNLFLHHENYPPAIVNVQNRLFYFGLLRRAMQSYYARTAEGISDKATPCEITFNNYIASGVHDACIEAQRMIHGFHTYIIDLGTSEKQVIRGLKRRFDMHFRAGSHIGHVNIVDMQKGYLRLVGDIDREHVCSIISGYDGYNSEPRIYVPKKR